METATADKKSEGFEQQLRALQLSRLRHGVKRSEIPFQRRVPMIVDTPTRGYLPSFVVSANLGNERGEQALRFSCTRIDGFTRASHVLDGLLRRLRLQRSTKQGIIPEVVQTVTSHRRHIEVVDG